MSLEESFTQPGPRRATASCMHRKRGQRAAGQQGRSELLKISGSSCLAVAAVHGVDGIRVKLPEGGALQRVAPACSCPRTLQVLEKPHQARTRPTEPLVLLQYDAVRSSTSKVGPLGPLAPPQPRSRLPALPELKRSKHFDTPDTVTNIAGIPWQSIDASFRSPPAANGPDGCSMSASQPASLQAYQIFCLFARARMCNRHTRAATTTLTPPQSPKAGPLIRSRQRPLLDVLITRLLAAVQSIGKGNCGTTWMVLGQHTQQRQRSPVQCYSHTRRKKLSHSRHHGHPRATTLLNTCTVVVVPGFRWGWIG